MASLVASKEGLISGKTENWTPNLELNRQYALKVIKAKDR